LSSPQEFLFFDSGDAAFIALVATKSRPKISATNLFEDLVVRQAPFRNVKECCCQTAWHMPIFFVRPRGIGKTSTARILARRSIA